MSSLRRLSDAQRSPGRSRGSARPPAGTVPPPTSTSPRSRAGVAGSTRVHLAPHGCDASPRRAAAAIVHASCSERSQQKPVRVTVRSPRRPAPVSPPARHARRTGPPRGRRRPRGLAASSKRWARRATTASITASPGLGRDRRADRASDPVRVEQRPAVTAGQVVALAGREPLGGDADRVHLVQHLGEPRARAPETVPDRAGRDALQQLVVAVDGAAEVVVRTPPHAVAEGIGAAAATAAGASEVLARVRRVRARPAPGRPADEARVAGRQGPAHLLELRARRHLLGEQRGLDAVEETLEPADELGLRDPELGVASARLLGERQGDPLAAPPPAPAPGPARARRWTGCGSRASRARPASSSGCGATSSSSCLIMLPMRMTLAGCSMSSVGLGPSSPVRARDGHALGGHDDHAVADLPSVATGAGVVAAPEVAPSGPCAGSVMATILPVGLRSVALTSPDPPREGACLE